MRYPAPGRMVDIGGFRLHLNCSGSGSPAVILDAALGGSSISWTLVQPAIAARTAVCSYDRAGLGWSEAGPMPRTAGRVADELRTLLESAAIAPPFVLVGHSYGGFVMRIFTARYRRVVAGLILVDPAHPEDWVNPAPKELVKIERGAKLCQHGASAARFGLARLVSALTELGAIPAARAIARMVSRGRLSREDEGILAPLWKLPPPARRPLRQFWAQAKFYDALRSHIESVPTSAAETLDADAGGYGDLPLVTISSTDPGDYRLRQQEALAKLSTRGRHIIASNSGHWIPLDQPAIVIDTIERMIDAVRAQPATNASHSRSV
jgi:pimeloyl-ACP methyl ester carboxylesterase